jgi:hypothetical protein
MLRFFVLLLLLANSAYFLWSQGYLASLGFAPANQAEPQRLQAQIKPEAIALLNATEAKRVEALALAPAPKAPECLQSALLSDTQTEALRSALSTMSSNAWRIETAVEPARWIIYMGKYANADALAKKKTELRKLGLAFETLRNPELEPGFSLGVYASQVLANESMAKFTSRGVRTAKVLQEVAERKGSFVQFPAVDDALRSQLEGIKPLLGTSGLATCKPI